jgi:hypothetical protein
MGVTATVQDLIGKYSVTGVLKERLELAAEKADFDAHRFESERAELLSKITALAEENTRINTQLTLLSHTTRALEEERAELRQQLHALQQVPPTTPLDMGAEITLAALMNTPSGVSPREIFSRSALRATVNDALVWIDEFRELGFVVQSRADAGNGSEYRLTPSGRKYAREYFAKHG